MASKPIILSIDKIRTADGSKEITTESMISTLGGGMSNAAGTVNNDLGITLDSSSGDDVYTFTATPTSAPITVQPVTTNLNVGQMMMWDGTNWINSPIAIEIVP